jgi:hypothetical protein
MKPPPVPPTISAFTVDRLRSIKAGDVLGLEQYGDVRPPDLQAHVDLLFPLGVSSHGERYFLSAAQDARLADPYIELIWEYVRRACFPERPSRFTSVFACRTPEDARCWRADFGQRDDPIWHVQSTEGFVADMALLAQGGSILQVSNRAHLYWRGDTHPEIETFWEYLLRPPATVVKRVD